MCFLGLMAWAQRLSGAVSGVWRGVSECRRCQSKWAPHTSWKNSEQLGPECSLLLAGLGRANHLCLSGSASLAGQLSRRREQMWLVRVWLGRPRVLWMSQSPGSRASASGFLGLGRRFEEGGGVGVRGLGGGEVRQEPVRGGCGLRCSRPALALPLRTTRRQASGAPLCTEAGQPRLTPPVPLCYALAPCPLPKPPRGAPKQDWEVKPSFPFSLWSTEHWLPALPA